MLIEAGNLNVQTAIWREIIMYGKNPRVARHGKKKQTTNSFKNTEAAND